MEKGKKRGGRRNGRKGGKKSQKREKKKKMKERREGIRKEIEKKEVKACQYHTISQHWKCTLLSSMCYVYHLSSFDIKTYLSFCAWQSSTTTHTSLCGDFFLAWSQSDKLTVLDSDNRNQ